jgi:hypothetical protein
MGKKLYYDQHSLILIVSKNIFRFLFELFFLPNHLFVLPASFVLEALRSTLDAACAGLRSESNP